MASRSQLFRAKKELPDTLWRRLRVRMGLSQAGFSKLLEVTPGTVQRWESGTYQPEKFYQSIMKRMAQQHGVEEPPADGRLPMDAAWGKHQKRYRPGELKIGDAVADVANRYVSGEVIDISSDQCRIKVRWKKPDGTTHEGARALSGLKRPRVESGTGT